MRPDTLEKPLQVVNVTRNSTLADNARRARNFLSRGRGLMFTKQLPAGSALIIEPCNSIHMFFMSYPLDILFLDKDSRVVFMYRGIKPWRLGRIVKGAKLAVELPEGTINRSGTELGDAVRIG